MIAILFGPPGAGKGTQAGVISVRLGIPHISTGAMFRAEIASESELGREIAPLVNAGGLVPDDLTVRTLDARMQRPDAVSGVLLDGFPRTVAQARALDDMLKQRSQSVAVVINLEVPESVLADRIAIRATTDGRSDDTQEALQQRIDVYHEQTEPVLGYYEGRGTRVETVDGVGAIEEVSQRILSSLGTPAL